MTTEEKETYIKYDGEDAKKFREWATKVKAIASRRSWLDALLKTTTQDRTSKDTAAIEMIKNNNKAYHYLVMACTGKAFNNVQAAEDAEGYGNARKAWVELTKRYSDLSETDLIVLTTEFNSCKIKKLTDDPTLWYAELEHIQAKMVKAGAQTKSDPEMVATIMMQIPKEYEMATQALQVKTSKERTLELVKTIYWEYWSYKYKNTNMKENVPEENQTLYADGREQSKTKKPWKKYKGDCSWCGIQGHKAVDCMKRKAAENKPDGTRIPENQKKCYRCKANRHIARNYLEKTVTKTGDAFFVGMCDDEEEENEDEEQEEENEDELKEEDIGHCPNCGGVGLVGLECADCEDSGLIYENEHGRYQQPESTQAQTSARVVQPRYFDLPILTAL